MDLSTIQNIIEKINAANGGPLRLTTAHPHPHINALLRELADELGVADSHSLTFVDKLGLYTVACKNVSSAVTLVRSLNTRGAALKDVWKPDPDPISTGNSLLDPHKIDRASWTLNGIIPEGGLRPTMPPIDETDPLVKYVKDRAGRATAPTLTSEPSWGEPSAFKSIEPEPARASAADLNAIRNMIKEEVHHGALEPLQEAMVELHDDVFKAVADAQLGNVAVALEAMKAEIHKATAEALKTLTPTTLMITGPDKVNTNLGLVHRDTPTIIKALSAGVNVYLHGPAGSGKTTVAHKCADAFMVKFYFAAKVESEYQLMGFKDAKGDTVRTQFREAYEHGGVFLFDEMDASSPSAVVALNAALANDICPFPDGIVTRHAQFLCIGAGNTKLTGATRAYAGRNQLDAASINRFAFIEFGYDDELERALATDQEWCTYVQRVRAVVAERGLNHLVTPRATYDGCKLLAKGLDWDTVADMCVFKGLDSDTVKQIQRSL